MVEQKLRNRGKVIADGRPGEVMEEAGNGHGWE
jgi:hypothetical protein